MRGRIRLVPFVLVVASCGSGSAIERAEATGEPEVEESGVVRRGSDRPGVPGTTALARGRIRYDLLAHPARAEVREGETLAVDLGAPGGAKHTLGGWQTDFADAIVEDTTVALVAGTRARLRISWDRSEPAELVLRARRFRGPVNVYLGRTSLGELALPEDGSFGVARVPLPADELGPGEHTLLFRARGTGNVPGGGRASLAIDWMRVASSGATVAETAVSDAQELVVWADGSPVIRIPEGLRVGWPMEVPSGARLRGVVAAPGGARVSVVACADGAEPRVIGRIDGGEAAAPFDLDLAALAGVVARIELRAEGGEARVARPAVVTLDAPEEIAERPRPTNVLVYLIDTLRADKLAPYNPETRVRTPGLMRFLESASTLSRAHTQENWTKPSVATLLSSLLPWEHTAVRGESVVPGSVELLPEMLAEDGFYTGSFIANGYVSDRFGFRQGWDTYRNYIREGRRTPAQYVAADVLEWLDSRPSDRPFFLYVHTIDPHVPYRPPDEFVSMYEESAYRGPVDFRRDATLLENIKLGRLRLGAADKARLEALYDGEISYHDVHFAAILDGLERRGLADDTMVVITSDHGEEFWDHGSVGHGHNVYEELLHVPMFVRLPGVTDEPRPVSEPVGLVDVLPTVLDALGKEIPDHVSGRSFLPLLLGRDEPAPRYAVSGFMDGWRTIVVGRHKLIQRTADIAMLHDLDADPDEQTDIASARPITTSYLRGLLGLALAQSAEPIAGASPRARRPRHRPEGTQVDRELADQLRALGYVDDWR